MKVIDADIFWSKVKKRGPNDCWIWQGKFGTGDYGYFVVNRKHLRAHRVAYELSTGVKPGVLSVCHTCDNRRCMNPQHLWLGTRRENNQDRHRKGRTSAGEAHYASKLTEKIVLTLRRRSNGESLQSLADEFKLDVRHVSLICLRKRWKHIGGNVTRKKKRLTTEQVKQIRAEFKSGTRQRELVKKYGVSSSSISMIVNRQIWR